MPVRPKASRAPAASPEASPAAQASTAPLALRHLAKPATATRTIAGTVSFDAAYAIATTPARLLSNNGSSLLAVGAAAFDGAIGAAVLANNGGRVVSDHGAGVIGQNGASVLSNSGGSLVSNNSSNLIGKIRAESDANLIGKIRSEGDAGLIGKIRFEVLQAAAPPLGTVAPAAGVAVRVFDIRNGSAVPIGLDEDGKPVYEVLTGAGGGYEVYPPADRLGNLVLHAGVPDVNDHRLRFNLIVPPRALAEAVDEDTSMATYFLHRSLVRSFLIWTEPAPHPADSWVPFTNDPGVQGQVRAGRQKLKDEAGRLGLDRLTSAQRTALAERMVDLLVARVDHGSARLYFKGGPLGYTGPDERCFDAYVAVLRGVRDAATTRMRALAAEGEDPFAYFAARDYVKAAEARLGKPFVFKKPADLVDFMLEAYFTDPSLAPMESVLGLAAFSAELGIDTTLGTRFEAAALGSNLESARALYLGDGALMAEMFELMRAAKP